MGQTVSGREVNCVASCSTCRSLRFDDKRNHGLAERSAEGNLQLYFNPPHAGRVFPVTDWNDTLPDLPVLKGSAYDGCQFCDFLRQTIIDKGLHLKLGTHETTNICIFLYYKWGVRSPYPATEPFTLSPFPHESQRNGLVFLHMVLEASDGASEMIVFSVHSRDEAVTHWLEIDKSTQGEPLSDQNVALVDKHLQYCLANHAVYRAGFFLPTRLIDLGQDNAAHPRLVVTCQEIDNQAFLPETVRYAALSYCWGPPVDAATQLKTERRTLSSRMQKIPEAEMSTVMRDAVAVCRALKIRFLWVDSVCIVQDDKSDWEAESQQMGSIYRHSLLTICAPVSHSCHQGFLSSRIHKIDVPFRSGIETSIAGSYTIENQGLESEMSLLHPSNRTPYNIDIGVSSWATRGWVFQERKLSPRKLVFGRSMFHLVCAHESISQNGLVLPSPVTESLVPVFQALESNVFNYEDVHMAWAEVASQYADLALHQPLDRLPAISGLAKLFAESVRLPEDSYAAGLWKPHLLKGYGLLWQREAVHSRQELLSLFRAAQHFIAPTWSWANQARSFKPGYLHYNLHQSPTRPHSRVEFQKMDIQTARAGLNAFGSVTSGTIMMTGRLKTYASLRMSKQYFSTHARRVFEGENHIADCVLDWTVHQDGEEQDELLLLPLLSTCPGVAPGLLIYDELKGFDMLLQGGEARQVVPSSDPYTFSATLNATVSNRTTTGGGQEDTKPERQHCAACTDKENADRDVFGIVLYRSDTPGKYWRVGVFFSEALETGGLALFRDTAYQEFDIV